MAAVGAPTRQSRVSMSVSMSLVQGGTAGAGGAAGAVLGMFISHLKRLFNIFYHMLYLSRNL